MRVDFLQEQLKEFWESNCLPGGFTLDTIKGELVIKTDCMICKETKQIIQYDEKHK